jgi:acyl carrier protein
VSDDLNDKIKAIMAAVFKVDIAEIKEEISAANFEKWDSLAHINLVVALEQEFEVRIPDDLVEDLLSFKLVELTVREALIHEA